MKHFIFLCLTVLFLDVSLFAQTQKIAHKSHSGTGENFVLNSKNKNNIGIPSGFDNFIMLQRDSLALLSFLQDSTIGKKWAEAFEKEDTGEGFHNRLNLNEDRAFIKESRKSEVGDNLLEASMWYRYKILREYILGLLERHKKDTPNGKSGSILKKTDKIKDYASFALLIGVACAGFWLYRQGKIV